MRSAFGKPSSSSSLLSAEMSLLILADPHHGHAASPLNSSISSFAVVDGLPKSPVEPSSETSETATSWSGQDTIIVETPPTVRPRVRFCPQHDNQIHDASQATSHERYERWYTNDELYRIKVQTRKFVALLIRQQRAAAAEGYKKCWSRCLHRAYQGLITANNLDDVQQVIATHKTALTPMIVGTEQWVIPCRRRARAEQRVQILRYLDEIHLSDLSPEEKVLKMRQASRATSRPSRLYACLTASLAYHTEV